MRKRDEQFTELLRRVRSVEAALFGLLAAVYLVLVGGASYGVWRFVLWLYE